MSDRGNSAPGRRCWAAVPFKGPVGSKRRLSGLLDPDERSRLSLAMLDDVLGALLAVPAIERVLLLRPTGSHHLPSQSSRLTIVNEDGEQGGPDRQDCLNWAIRQAQRMAQAEGATSLLIVPADLPLLSPSDLAALLDAAELAPIVIAPDRANDGTNALLLTPPSALDPSFGETSFGRHRERAEHAGLKYSVLERASLGLDLDTPTDLATLLTTGRDCRALRLLRELHVGSRLAQSELAQARNTTI
jgi:2-phospho-L-lactate guanylyltransferase